jgi:hypothetical protein
VENQRAEKYFSPISTHDESVTVQGLEDLFHWASETVEGGLDGRARRAKEQKVRRQVLNIIHRSAELQAQSKHADELAYLQRRVIALQAVLAERSDELSSLKQITVTQYYALQRIPELEEKVVQLEAQSGQLEQAEEDRKHLMNALSRLNKERDFLEELLTANEAENTRLALLLTESRQEVAQLKNRRWWHIFWQPQTT